MSVFRDSTRANIHQKTGPPKPPWRPQSEGVLKVVRNDSSKKSVGIYSRLPVSVRDEAKELAAAHGESLDAFVSAAIQEKNGCVGCTGNPLSGVQAIGNGRRGCEKDDSGVPPWCVTHPSASRFGTQNPTWILCEILCPSARIYRVQVR